MLLIFHYYPTYMFSHFNTQSFLEGCLKRKLFSFNSLGHCTVHRMEAPVAKQSYTSKAKFSLNLVHFLESSSKDVHCIFWLEKGRFQVKMESRILLYLFVLGFALGKSCFVFLLNYLFGIWTL